MLWDFLTHKVKDAQEWIINDVISAEYSITKYFNRRAYYADVGVFFSKRFSPSANLREK